MTIYVGGLFERYRCDNLCPWTIKPGEGKLIVLKRRGKSYNVYKLCCCNTQVLIQTTLQLLILFAMVVHFPTVFNDDFQCLIMSLFPFRFYPASVRNAPHPPTPVFRKKQMGGKRKRNKHFCSVTSLSNFFDTVGFPQLNLQTFKPTTLVGLDQALH